MKVYRLSLLVIVKDAATGSEFLMSLAAYKKADNHAIGTVLIFLSPFFKILMNSSEFNLKYECPFWRKEWITFAFFHSQTMSIKKQSHIPRYYEIIFRLP